MAHEADVSDEAAVADVARGLDLDMGTDPDSPVVRVDGRDVGTDIRETRVSSEVSKVAANQAVRAELRRRQREVIAAARRGDRHGVVAEGRMAGDIFVADNILAKHDERYMPPELGNLAAEHKAGRTLKQ